MNDSSAMKDARLVNAEHEVQFQLIKDLRKTIAQGADAADEHERLANWCRAHFLSEELLMRQHAYPNFDEHVADHEQMIEALDGLTDPAAIDALSGFLARHIREHDGKLHAYLEKV